MKTEKRRIRLLALLATLVIILLFGGQALAVDDGARAYWKGRAGTQGVSFQYLSLDLQASDSKQFAPGQYIYPNADTEASIFIANYVRHITLFNRPSSLSFAVAGGSVDADFKANAPGQIVPPGITPGVAFSQSSSGFADPSVALVVNLFGTPPLKTNFDLIDYEPTWTLDTAVMLALPVGAYDDSKLVNMGLNRWFGRIAFPLTYHFGVFTPGYRSSFELTPSVWLFAENDDFMGQKLENDPMWQLEAHLTHDFTPSFFGSLDLLYRSGFQSEVNGVEVGEELDIGNLGFTLSYQVTDNLSIRTGFSSNVFGDNDLDNSMVRLQFVYGWHRDFENMKKLKSGH
ncbi:MAG: transporter [Deltaproteobacteria bacterium]|nr:transporter [Deltaproteobacteria bacterium]MBW2326531.1 transporter [Deltaproteobacteria bacterium]